MSATTNTLPTIYDDLVSDTTPWTMADIAVGLDVQPQTVRSWRKDALGAERLGSAAPAAPHPNHLPNPDIPVTGKPTWKAGTIRKWAMQTGRMTPEGVPQRLKPPGRPRTERATAKAA